MSDELHRIELTEADIRWLAKGAPWHLPSVVEGLDAKWRIADAARAWVAEHDAPPADTPPGAAEYRDGHAATRWLAESNRDAAREPRRVPDTPSEPVTPPRKEWQLCEHHCVFPDPDWVLVRPCDLRPGDRIAWGDGDAVVAAEPLSKNGQYLAPLTNGEDALMRPWSPVLVRRATS